MRCGRPREQEQLSQRLELAGPEVQLGVEEAGKGLPRRHQTQEQEAQTAEQEVREAPGW